MAFTIRELSKQADENLNRLLEKNPAFFKTKTSAVQFALEQYYELKAEIKELYQENENLKQELFKLKQEKEIIQESIKNLIDFVK